MNSRQCSSPRPPFQIAFVPHARRETLSGSWAAAASLGLEGESINPRLLEFIKTCAPNSQFQPRGPGSRSQALARPPVLIWGNR